LLNVGHQLTLPLRTTNGEPGLEASTTAGAPLTNDIDARPFRLDPINVRIDRPGLLV
jgi:hypothetical protein